MNDSECKEENQDRNIWCNYNDIFDLQFSKLSKSISSSSWSSSCLTTMSLAPPVPTISSGFLTVCTANISCFSLSRSARSKQALGVRVCSVTTNQILAFMRMPVSSPTTHTCSLTSTNSRSSFISSSSSSTMASDT